MKFNPMSWFRNETTYTIGDDAVLQAFYGALSVVSSSGVRVNKDSALRSTAFLACLIVRSETHSALPVDVFRKEGRNRFPADDDPVSKLFSFAPNDLMNSGEFWRWEDLREDISGNAYARVVWRGYDPVEIWPLFGDAPRLVWDKATKRAVYAYRGDDITPADVYPARDILHFKGPVLKTPLEGASLVDLASESIGVSIASEQFFARLLGNGNHFPGWLETDTQLKPDDIAALSTQLRGFAGVVQAGVMRIFDRGLKYKSNPMTIKDADLTAQMRWQLQQICSIMRVPMAMVQDLTNGTYTNSEQQDLWLAKHTITPMCVNKERVIRHKLFDRKPDHYMRFNMSGLLRGDYETRAKAESTLVNASIMIPNEARALEDMNPVPGLDAPLRALNYGTVSPDGSVAPAKEPAPADVLRPIVHDALTCIRRRHEADEKRGRSIDDTIAFAAEKLEPIVQAHIAAGLDFDPDSFIHDALSDTSGTLSVEGGSHA